MKRMEADDANAIHSFGCYYYNEELGFPQSYDKAQTEKNIEVSQY